MADEHDRTPELRKPAADPPAQRIGHAERDIAVRRLQLALHEGQLDLSELDRRLAQAYAAVTAPELGSVTADLPDTAIAPIELRTKSGEHKKNGQWTVPAAITAKCGSGTITIDFTEAFCPYAEVSFDVKVGSGSVMLIMPPGWRVDLDRVDTGSGSVVNKVTGPAPIDGPLLRLRGRVDSGLVKARYPRRKFLNWLLRHPY